jgi:hypothetical protein
MKKFRYLALIVCLSGCAICKTADNAEQCRTKQREHTQRHTDPGNDLFDSKAKGPPEIPR